MMKDDGYGHAKRLMESRMGVHPVYSGICVGIETIFLPILWMDGGVGHKGDAVLIRGRGQAVEMDRGTFLQIIKDYQPKVIQVAGGLMRSIHGHIGDIVGFKEFVGVGNPTIMVRSAEGEHFKIPKVLLRHKCEIARMAGWIRIGIVVPLDDHAFVVFIVLGKFQGGHIQNDRDGKKDAALIWVGTRVVLGQY